MTESKSEGFADVIREARKARGWSQAVLGRVDQVLSPRVA